MARAAVVGAGVVGLYAALALLASGYEVTVYEAVEPGAGASTRNANVLHVVQPPPGRLRRALAREGARLHRACAERLGYRVVETRLIIPALTPLEEALLPLVALAVKALAPHTAARLVSRREALALEPGLSRRTRRALLVEGYGVVDSREVIAALMEAVESLGGSLARGRVERLAPGGLVELEGGASEGPYSVVVNAAGAGAAAIAEASGAGRHRVDLVEGVMRLYRRPQLQAIVAPLPRPGPGKGGALIPQLDGSLLAGPTWGPSEEPWGRYARLLEEPPSGLRGEVRGLRTVSERRDFVIAASRLGGARAVHLLGIESPGLTAAPALALEALRAVGVRGKYPCTA